MDLDVDRSRDWCGELGDEIPYCGTLWFSGYLPYLRLRRVATWSCSIAQEALELCVERHPSLRIIGRIPDLSRSDVIRKCACRSLKTGVVRKVKVISV